MRGIVRKFSWRGALELRTRKHFVLEKSIILREKMSTFGAHHPPQNNPFFACADRSANMQRFDTGLAGEGGT